MVDDHISARARGDNDRASRATQQIQGVLGHCPRIIPKAAVKGWLATTRLLEGELNGNPLCFQNIDDGHADSRIKGINEAGDKKLYGFWFRLRHDFI